MTVNYSSKIKYVLFIFGKMELSECLFDSICFLSFHQTITITTYIACGLEETNKKRRFHMGHHVSKMP